jgi:DNA polymerase
MTQDTDVISPCAARQVLESLQRAGVTHLPRAKSQAMLPAAEAKTSEIAKPTGAAAPTTPPSPPPRASASSNSTPLLDAGYQSSDLPPAERVAALNVIGQEVARCTLCSELVANRSRTVFGVGNPQARLCFCGEAPGADEDRKGEPFVGAAGQLLNKIIENGLRMKREDVYILNICKCRPPGNRAPTSEEAANCRPF